MGNVVGAEDGLLVAVGEGNIEGLDVGSLIRITSKFIE